MSGAAEVFVGAVARSVEVGVLELSLDPGASLAFTAVFIGEDPLGPDPALLDAAGALREELLPPEAEAEVEEVGPSMETPSLLSSFLTPSIHLPSVCSSVGEALPDAATCSSF